KMRKFRFQLLSEWVAYHFRPCTVADVGGGKGLLSYLLQQRGFVSTVVDPVEQSLPDKYRDLSSARQVKIPSTATVPRVTAEFSTEMGRRFDLLVALHAHGVNWKILDAVKEYGVSCVILPCCVIGEPSPPPPGVDWFSWLVEHAKDQGLSVSFFLVN